MLVEPIQGEGGVRMTSARFMRKLRLLTRIYDVPLVFDEVQTGWGMTGRLWAHELFDLPCPPDLVTWAKKAQNGVLFVSEDCGALHPQTMCEQVKQHRAHLGIALDGDADRVIIADENGKVVDGDAVMAMCGRA